MNPERWDNIIKKLADSVINKPIVRNQRLNRAAVIIEPRKSDTLLHLLTWMIHLLTPFGWNFIIICGMQNTESIQKHISLLKVDDIVSVQTKPVNNMTIPEYSSLLKSIEFWESVKHESILIFQTDSILLNGNLEEFLHYDYVGAPWSNNTQVYIKGKVGNGGLSLRRRSGMIRAIEKSRQFKITTKKKSVYKDEDVFFAVECQQNLNIAPFELSKRFACETIFHENPCGVHKFWRYLTQEEVEATYKYIESFIQDPLQ